MIEAFIFKIVTAVLKRQLSHKKLLIDIFDLSRLFLVSS
ncbi:hypothetical protein SGADD02_00115 [Streptococcus gallolyticus]|uniref:Uncharacterized protein n=1 Tax=Streptococcus gallolyticus TaxID=315405 RepID=A0A139R4T2_9STRE|nr:hypothetical protein SGADD02_00115 [Streptococcus gallolyticus]KXU09772.1 hypothetical protein SGADD03_00502 [Streptococcus gallolyticus]